MRLNDYNINQIIAQSRLKINYKEICKQNIKLYIFILVILSIIDKFFPFVNGILLSALLPILLKTSIEIVSLLIIKKQANKKLEIITEQLRENGLFINKMRLKRAELGTIRHKKIVECSGVVKETEEVTVFQDYKTFALSVNENVMCRDCNETDKESAETALKQSGVFDKISTLPSGADTVLTREFDENGAGLSGGEAQKTAVARMFAGNFDIAILDEPSSALDPIAEYKMYENLILATKDKTVIYISHRLSSAVLSDNIFVLDSGTVIESGSHTALMKSKGKYAEMFALQASSYKKKERESYEEN